MRALAECTGKWVGWSVQQGRRIHEDLDLTCGGGRIRGVGQDADGDFEVGGYFDARGVVTMTRRYTYCTSGPEGIGIPYEYIGRWDGTMVAGGWRPSGFIDDDGGPFEMWPLDELGGEFEREMQAGGVRERELQPA